MSGPGEDLRATLATRFGEAIDAPVAEETAATLSYLAGHGVERRFDPGRSVSPELVRLVCACALSAPSKSDLQQRDIVVVSDPHIRSEIDDLLRTPWISRAPVFLVVCADGRRLVQIAEWRGRPFPNDHFDLLFNAVGDAAIALGWLQTATRMAGLGGCPISEIRHHAERISRLLRLPDRVIPFAGFCLGWPYPETVRKTTPRLALSTTLHTNGFVDATEAEIAAYDKRRAATDPYRTQRDPERFGLQDEYGWSEDKARQYSVPLRADFGAFVERHGFRLK